MEVIRDAILHLLVRDPSLEPRDIIVMCPDIEAFAPLVYAAFGHPEDDVDPLDGAAGLGSSDLPEVRVRLADRSLRQTNPLLSVGDALLQLAAGRVTASQVVDLAAREPVRRRFQFDDDELAQVERWIRDMGVRWGSMPPTEPTGACRISRPTPGPPVWTASCWAWPWPTRISGCSAGPSHSTTSPAGPSIWPVDWPSSCRGWMTPSTASIVVSPSPPGAGI